MAELDDDKKTDVFMPFYPGDYLKDTSDLSTEEHGAYFLLLLALWPAQGRLPNDARRLARIARVDWDRWPEVWAAIGRFFDVEGAHIVQRRLLRELQSAEKRRKAARENGRKGAAAKHGKPPSSESGGETLANGVAEPVANALANRVANSGSSPSPSPSPSPSQSEPDPEPPSNPDHGALAARAHAPAHAHSNPSAGPGPVSGTLQAPTAQGDYSDEPGSAYAWHRHFGRLWAEAYHTLSHGGGESDAKGIRRLEDLLARLHPQDARAAWEERDRIVRAFLTSADAKAREAKHKFVFFVEAFDGLRARASPNAGLTEKQVRSNAGIDRGLELLPPAKPTTATTTRGP